jgi:hypothetical protein
MEEMNMKKIEKYLMAYAADCRNNDNDYIDMSVVCPNCQCVVSQSTLREFENINETDADKLMKIELCEDCSNDFVKAYTLDTDCLEEIETDILQKIYDEVSEQMTSAVDCWAHCNGFVATTHTLISESDNGVKDFVVTITGVDGELPHSDVEPVVMQFSTDGRIAREYVISGGLTSIRVK